MSLPGNISLLARMPTPNSSAYGNVDGPASSTDNAVVLFDGTTGKQLKNSSMTFSGTTLSVPNGFTLGSAGILNLSSGLNNPVNINSGNGGIYLETGTGAVNLPAASGGLRLSNTVDQVTNYERLELLWSGNVAIIRTASGGTGTGRQLQFSAAGGANLNIRNGGNASGTFQFQTGSTGTVGAIFASFSGWTSTATSGTNVGFSLTPTYNQTSGTAANTDLLINRTETAVGSGSQYLIQAQVGGANRFLFDTGGSLGMSGGVYVGGTSITGGTRIATTGNFSTAAWGTAGTQIRVGAATITDTSTAGSGTAASAVFTSFAQPTLAATNSSVTTTDAATVYIANAPAAGTNQTITRAHALWIDSGSFRLDGTSGPGVATGTLTNAPSAGDPDKWIPINSDGTQYWIPAWSA